MIATRQQLNQIHADLTDAIAEAHAKDDHHLAFTLLGAANKVAEAEAILQSLALEVPLQFTDDNPLALKCNGVHTP